MNEPSSNTSTPVILPAKRKRGRPRKDGNILPKKDEGSSKPALLTSMKEGMRTTTVHHIHDQSNPNNDGSMIGRMVCGVIDGSFDAGYFLSVRVGNTGPFLRGVIFEPGRFAPLTSSNDIAPQAEMFQRREIAVPLIPCQQNPINEQSVGNQPAVQLGMQQPMVLRPVLPCVPQPSQSLSLMRNQSPQSMVLAGNMSNNNDVSSPTLAEKMMMQQAPRSTTYGSGNQFQSSPPPVENLRMVEQDDAMQVYEVSVQSEGLLVDTEPAKDVISESSSEARALHNNQVNQLDVGSGRDSSAQFRNDFNCLATENHVVLETPNRQSAEVKQNQDPYFELHQHIVVAEPDQKLTVSESGFQPRELIQDINLELHETPVITQTQYVPLENQENEHEMNTTSANTPHSISTEPANMEDQFDPGKLVHNELGSKNHGIKEAFVTSNSHFLPRELLPQSVGFVTENHPSTLKNDTEDAIHFRLQAKTSENNESIHSGNTSANGELHSLTAENARSEAMPFDLEIAAGETTWPGRPENQVSGFTACSTELNIVPGNTLLRTGTERNPGGLPESQQR